MKVDADDTNTDNDNANNPNNLNNPNDPHTEQWRQVVQKCLRRTLKTLVNQERPPTHQTQPPPICIRGVWVSRLDRGIRVIKLRVTWIIRARRARRVRRAVIIVGDYD